MPSIQPTEPIRQSHPPIDPAAVEFLVSVPPLTLFLVEDSRFAAEAVRLICRRAGLRLRRAETLSSADLHLRVYRPDIALIDLGLPDGSGLDLIDRLNRMKPRIARIVALSGDPVLEHAALRAGADAFLAKPLSLSAHLTPLLGVAVDLGQRLGVIDTALGLPSTARPSALESPRPNRNMGADPLALRDDLMRARDLLARGQEPASIGYAAQFLSGIARSLDDRRLMELAERVRQSGEPAPLLAHLTHCVEGQPLL